MHTYSTLRECQIALKKNERTPAAWLQKHHWQKCRYKIQENINNPGLDEENKQAAHMAPRWHTCAAQNKSLVMGTVIKRPSQRMYRERCHSLGRHGWEQHSPDVNRLYAAQNCITTKKDRTVAQDKTSYSHVDIKNSKIGWTWYSSDLSFPPFPWGYD